MKKFALLAGAAILVLVTATSCSSSDNNANTTDQQSADSTATPAVVEETPEKAIDSFACNVRSASSSGSVYQGFSVSSKDVKLEIYSEEGDNMNIGIVVNAYSKLTEPAKKLEAVSLSAYLPTPDGKRDYLLDHAQLSAAQLAKADAMIKACDKERTEQYIFKGTAPKAVVEAARTGEMSISAIVDGEK